MAAHIVTSHSNGISALQLQAQLGLGSYKSAGLLLQKLRRAVVDPERSLLEDVVEDDEAEIPLRRKADPPAGGGGRSPQGRMFVAAAVDLSPDGRRRRIRLAPIEAFSGATLKPFVDSAAAPGATVVTDGWAGCLGLPGYVHEAKVVGRMAAHVALKWTRRAFNAFIRAFSISNRATGTLRRFAVLAKDNDATRRPRAPMIRRPEPHHHPSAAASLPNAESRHALASAPRTTSRSA